MKKLKKLTDKFKALGVFAKKYAVFSAFIFVLLAYSFMVWRINVLTSQEPTPAQIDEKLLTVKRPVIDKNAVSKVQQLQDNNVQVKTLFKQARDNPFQE
jgi:hypothetical protein